MKILSLKMTKGVSLLTRTQLMGITASIDLDCEDPNIPIQIRNTLCYDPDHECITENAEEV